MLMKKSLQNNIVLMLLYLLPFAISAQTKITSGTVEDVNASTTITWPFNTGAAGQTASFSTGTEGYFNTNWIEIGSNLAYASTKVDFGITFTAFQPFIQNNTVGEQDFVRFNIRPKSGLNFTPTSVSFDSERFGTSGGKIDVIWRASDGTASTLATAVMPERNGVGTTHTSLDLSSLTIPASDGNCSLDLYIYALGNTKQVGIANVILAGIVKGTPSVLPVYKLNTVVSPTAAGTVTTLPFGDEFDAGTAIKVTAATRNFGFQFKQWEDVFGNVLSTEKDFSFTISQDTTIKAVYDTLVTYNFNLEILGSKWGKVLLTPAPTNGKYEAGTNVNMQVVSNQITNFSYWEDNSTASNRIVLMDGNKDFSANFDEIPFIVGWDLNPTTPNASRGADYYAETNNTGLLNVYNQDGTVTTWLGHPGSFSPLQTCAYLWTTAATFASNRRYWVATFSTANYSNVNIKSQMAGSYQHYLTQKMQVSTDGTNYSDLASVDLSTSAWSDLNAILPEAYEHQEKVYIRWIADTNSTLIGDVTGNDGTALTNIFVYADNIPPVDTIPPVLISAVPSEGSINATANGSVVLTFNERIKSGIGDCMLGETKLTPSFGSKTVSFQYSRLSYDTNYTFGIPAGALTDMSGNTFAGDTIHFRTTNRPVPTAKVYDVVVAKDGSGDFTSLQTAIDAIPLNNALPYLIFIKNGIYNEHIDIPVTKPNLRFIGQDRDKVVITDSRLCGEDGDASTPVYSVDPGATVVVKAENCYFENITFENSYGYQKQAGPQALAVYTNNDKMIFKNCWMRSYQDTYLTASKANFRGYLVDCNIQGAVDFIYGQGDFFFDKCTITCTRQSGGYIVAPNHADGTAWGYVFSSCTLDGPAGVLTYLGRPWHDAPKASFFNTIAKIGIYPVGWYYKMGAIPAIFADYNTMDADGNPLDLNQRISNYEYDIKDASGNITSTVKGVAKNSFTDEEAAQYTYENVVSGTDGWDPRSIIEPTEKPSNLTISSSGLLTWKSVSYAISYVITKDDIVVGFTTSESFQDNAFSSTSVYKVNAVAESGALSDASIATLVTNNPKLSDLKAFAYFENQKLNIDHLQSGDLILVYNYSGMLLAKVTAHSATLKLSIDQACIIKIVSDRGYKVLKLVK